MAVLEDGGREAITHYRIEERFANHTLLRVALETGRTHQIRVHLSSRQMPIVGDPVYSGRFKVPAGISNELRHTLNTFPRQALHATLLALVHPETGEEMEWEAEVPNDIAALLDRLRAEDERLDQPV